MLQLSLQSKSQRPAQPRQKYNIQNHPFYYYNLFKKTKIETHYFIKALPYFYLKTLRNSAGIGVSNSIG